jgi:hypothetical protein
MSPILYHGVFIGVTALVVGVSYVMRRQRGGEDRLSELNGKKAAGAAAPSDLLATRRARHGPIEGLRDT